MNVVVINICLLIFSMVKMATFSIGVILLLNMWGGKRSGIITDTNKELADVGKCMAALKVGEKR